MQRFLGFLFLILLISCPMFCLAQESPPSKAAVSVGLSVFANQVNVPFAKQVSEKQHLGFSLDLNIAKARNGVYQFSHQVALGYFKQADFLTAFFLKYQPIFSFELAQVVRINIPLGLGYAHSFPTEDGYSLQNGEYVPRKNKGKAHLLPSIGLGASIRLHRILNVPIEISGSYEMFSLMPYAPKGSLPFIPYTSFITGLKYQF